MTIYSGQIVVPASGTVVTRLPPGPASVTISNAGTATIYLGAATSASTLSVLSGMPVPSGGIFTFSLFQGSPGYNLVGVATSGGSSTVGFLIANSAGLPQPGVD